ncbi:MAG: hydantoinase B/oxoprolinase family protein, partial [Alphaproteobacteria bacterium]|nr:hydantoinase B/oxoprolinase family protein [Alphaproteobacteria bacterium]
MYKAGERDDTVFRIIERNVRMPETVLGDINSQIAACRIGERGLIELAERYGQQGFIDYCVALLDYTERRTRAEIAKLPDGSYSFADYIDGDGFDSGVITIQVKITVAGDEMSIDFEGTSGQ